jgi:hypothetical protein
VKATEAVRWLFVIGALFAAAGSAVACLFCWTVAAGLAFVWWWSL